MPCRDEGCCYRCRIMKGNQSEISSVASCPGTPYNSHTSLDCGPLFNDNSSLISSDFYLVSIAKA